MKKNIDRDLTQDETDALYALYYPLGHQVYLWSGKNDGPEYEVPVLFSSIADAERWLLEMLGLGLCDLEHVVSYQATPVSQIDIVEGYDNPLTARFWLAEYVDGEMQFRLKRHRDFPFSN